MENEELVDYSGIALLVLDMQPAFLDACSHPALLRNRVRFAVRAADLLGLEVIFTEQAPERIGRTIPELREFSDGPVFGKRSFSALRCPELNAFRESEGIHHLLITGIETPICVYQTAIDAIGMDIEVTVLSDAIGQRRDADRDPTLTVLREAGCHILPSEAVFYSILGSADHPDFRAFTDLVKEASALSR